MMGGGTVTRDWLARRWLDAASALSPRGPAISSRTVIGVFLLWGIGDAVLTTPFLHALRAAYPGARIVALGKPWLAELFGEEALFDEFVTLVPPWTRHSGKYRLWSRDWREFARQAFAIRRGRFDLLISLRPDPRETALACLLSVREFAGYPAAGGRRWVSVDLGRSIVDEPACYRGELAAQAAKELIGTRPDAQPILRRVPSQDLARQLAHAGYAGGPVLAVAFGAAHPIRRWTGQNIAETLVRLRHRPGAYLIIETDNSPSFEVPGTVPTVRWRGSLAELKGALALADVLFCADSGALHVGTAVGCRTVSVFGPGLPSRFAPRGPLHAHAVKPMPCRPCYDNCIHPSPLCMDRIEVDTVAELIDAALAKVTVPRLAGAAERVSA